MVWQWGEVQLEGWIRSLCCVCACPYCGSLFVSGEGRLQSVLCCLLISSRSGKCENNCQHSASCPWHWPQRSRQSRTHHEIITKKWVNLFDLCGFTLQTASQDQATNGCETKPFILLKLTPTCSADAEGISEKTWCHVRALLEWNSSSSTEMLSYCSSLNQHSGFCCR